MHGEGLASVQTRFLLQHAAAVVISSTWLNLLYVSLTLCTPALALRQFVGTVTRTTDVRPELFTGTFRCMECMTGACSRGAQQGAMHLHSCSGTGAAVE